MPTRAGCFIDVSNLYFCLQKKYHRKLSYAKYMAFITSMYPKITVMKSYVASNGKNMGFIAALQKLGHDVRVKQVKEYSEGDSFRRKCDMDVDIALDIMESTPAMDVCVLGSADGDMAPVVERLNRLNITTVAIACGVSSELRSVCKECIEIPPSLLE